MNGCKIRPACPPIRAGRGILGVLLGGFLFAGAAFADEPYAPSREYDLENVRTHLRFDLQQRKVLGNVTHTLSILREGTSELRFDSVALAIEGVTVNKKAAKFRTSPNQLIVSLPHPARRGEKFEVTIRYEGQPKKGLYFVLPDHNYPERQKEIWSQGEAEDTRYYIPIYDYPNDRTTSEMLLTVPGDWITVSNGRLVGVKREADGTKTWDWKQTEPLSTYLISVVAGEFVETTHRWRGKPIEYVVPRGEANRIPVTFARTKKMLDLYSDQLGVPYPWDKYAQSAVDDFVVGGMENTSATTLTVRGLLNPALAPERRQGSDRLISHELAHQWFGDLVTCKDWANLWLNEGFATFFEHFWNEKEYGADAAAYQFWLDQNSWMNQVRLYSVPIVTRDFKDPIEYAGNIYTKGGWVLRMLRERLGENDFWAAMHHYLEVNRGKNVVTADLVKAIEDTTGRSVDEFFHQWVYRAGAPKFQVHSTYDPAAHVVKLEVKQTQKREGLVGIFHVRTEVEITTAAGRKSFPIDLSQADQTLTFPADGPPLMILFDKGDTILKSVDFQKTLPEWIYQLEHAETVPDRADAAQSLGGFKPDPAAIAALGAAARKDPFWGVRVQALEALGRIGGPDAAREILASLDHQEPWVREAAVNQLGKFKDNPAVVAKLEDLANRDPAYRVRAAALQSLAALKVPNALAILEAAVKSESPDDVLRGAALRGLGALGDDRAVPLLMEWSAAGRPLDTRGAAISSLAHLDKKNKAITERLISYLSEPYAQLRFPTIFALGARGDPEAIAPLEAWAKKSDLSIGLAALVRRQIEALRARAAPPAQASPAAAPPASATLEQILRSLEQLQYRVAEISERLGKLETHLAGAPRK